jgi:hypothetical protein
MFTNRPFFRTLLVPLRNALSSNNLEVGSDRFAEDKEGLLSHRSSSSDEHTFASEHCQAQGKVRARHKTCISPWIWMTSINVLLALFSVRRYATSSPKGVCLSDRELAKQTSYYCELCCTRTQNAEPTRNIADRDDLLQRHSSI